jgi:hypothetical protein
MPVDYSFDLDPLEDICGDQQPWDIWVVDEETGEPFRPESYQWQDLRTRIIYGAAPAKRYDSQLMGLALRVGVKFFGLFRNIYTDNGRPELSNYIKALVKEIGVSSVSAHETIDYPLDLSGIDAEEVCCDVKVGRHTRAIAYNGKAKMVEATHKALRQIMIDVFKAPGYVKSLTDSKEIQDIDQKELQRLAKEGKLWTWREFVINYYDAVAYYNNERGHRGVLKEWKWRPKPKQATPNDCFNMCIRDGWKPRYLPDDVVDLMFLPWASKSRVVDRGRISFQNELYEHQELNALHKEKVELKYDPLDLGWVLVFHKGKFVCQAIPVEYSSMKDQTLKQRKITEKARLQKTYTTEYRELTSGIPDVRRFSQVPVSEKAAPLIGKGKRQKLIESQDSHRVKSQKELDTEIAAIQANSKRQRKPLFESRSEHYRWCLDQIAQGKDLEKEDRAFLEEFEQSFDKGVKDFWSTYKETIGLADTGGENAL